MFDFTELRGRHIGLFTRSGVYNIQRIDETAPDYYTDEDAIREVVSLARSGHQEAIAILHLEGWRTDEKEQIEFIKSLHESNASATDLDTLAIMRSTFVNMAGRCRTWAGTLLHNNRNTDSRTVLQTAEMWDKVVEVFDQVVKQATAKNTPMPREQFNREVFDREQLEPPHKQ